MSPKQSKRSLETEDAFSDTPRVLSDEEKRQLILAHASSRTPKDPVQRLTMWAGMFVAIAVIAGGWWLSVGKQIQQGFGGAEKEDFRTLGAQLDAFTEQLRTDPIVNAPNIPSPTNGASAAEDADMVQAIVGEGSGNANRDDLFGVSGSFASTTTPTEPQASSESADPFIDPNDPGLTPEYTQ